MSNDEWESAELTTVHGGSLHVQARAGANPDVAIMEGADGMFILSPRTARALAYALTKGADHADGVRPRADD